MSTATSDFILSKYKISFDDKTPMPIDIPHIGRDGLPELFHELGLKVGAEIGVRKGEFTIRFCEAGLKMYAIDPWLSYSDYLEARGQSRMDWLYDQAQRVLASHDCAIIRKTSMEAVKDFEEALTSVFICESSISCTWTALLLLKTERRGRCAVPFSVARTRRFLRIVF